MTLPLGWIPPFDWIDPADPLWLRLEAERRAGRLPIARRDAMLGLLILKEADGSPVSNAAAAELTGCSVRTVRRARIDARKLRLLP